MGEVFAGRYELLGPVAEGGMGTVWVARDLTTEPGSTTDPLLAVKVLRGSDAGLLLRFVREQGVRISHPHVLTPLSWAGDDNRVLFAMPLVRGGSVTTLLGDFHRLPVRWVVTLLDQALAALEAVHAQGLVHRDVKPANLLLQATGSERPHLLLSDFGIAAPVDGPRLTRASQVVGSPGYLSPEQARGADPDPRQDLYAVGVVGLEMLTGEPPPASLEVARSLVLERPGLGPLVELLGLAASDDPASRPPSAGEFRRRLLELGTMSGPDEEEPFVFDQFGEGPTVAPEPVSSSRGRAAAYALIATSIICVLAAIGVLLWL